MLKFSANAFGTDFRKNLRRSVQTVITQQISKPSSMRESPKRFSKVRILQPDPALSQLRSRLICEKGGEKNRWESEGLANLITRFRG